MRHLFHRFVDDQPGVTAIELTALFQQVRLRPMDANGTKLRGPVLIVHCSKAPRSKVNKFVFEKPALSAAFEKSTQS